MANPRDNTNPKLKDPSKGGRPSSYKPEYADLARKACMAFGGTDEELATFFDVATSTINNWKIDHPEFLESIKAGKGFADAEVAAKLFHRATGYSHDAVKIVANATTGDEHIVPFTQHYPPDTAAAIFWLKNRQRDKWRDKVDQEITGANGAPLVPVLNVTIGRREPGSSS